MALLDMLMGRGGLAAANPSPSVKQPGSRGQTAWSSGFEGRDKALLMELLRKYQMEQALMQEMATRQVPLMAGRGRG